MGDFEFIASAESVTADAPGKGAAVTPLVAARSQRTRSPPAPPGRRLAGHPGGTVPTQSDSRCGERTPWSTQRRPAAHEDAPDAAETQDVGPEQALASLLLLPHMREQLAGR
ncbi:hypothetical protein GCM10018780_87500 [Streptomyces lanatus]|nr:hypothetical protein GCM10018780_87500 [Streptomyces lanatus]